MKIEVDIDLSIDELAEIFINWDDKKQADFINKVGQHFKQADFDAELQCCFIADHITKFGRDFIYTMTNFIKSQKFTDKSGHYDMLINSCEHDTLR